MDRRNKHVSTSVAKGRHIVPHGVAVHELDGSKRKFSRQCPTAVQDLFLQHGLVDAHKDLVMAIVDNKKVRGTFGTWKDHEVGLVLAQFKDRFAQRGIKAALCKRDSSKGRFLWFEFINVNVASQYVPQYDVSNLSQQVIRTKTGILRFPNGIAVAQLSQHVGALEKFVKTVPSHVKDLLDPKGLMEVYQDMAQDIVTNGVAGSLHRWDTDKCNEVVKSFAPRFAEGNVEVFVSEKNEILASYGAVSGSVEIVRWLEFVDRDQQPNYKPQRDAEKERKDDCVIL